MITNQLCLVAKMESDQPFLPLQMKMTYQPLDISTKCDYQHDTIRFYTMTFQPLDISTKCDYWHDTMKASSYGKVSLPCLRRGIISLETKAGEKVDSL